jgi:eukaryotic-like serine/threonine-protein kinase
MMGENDEEVLLDLLLRWEELRARGQEVSVDDLCRGRPDLRAAMEKRIRALEATFWLEKPLNDDDPPEGDVPFSLPSEPKIFSGRYRLDVLIAEGGFAQVWKGTDLELKRVVAVKIPKPSNLVSPESFFAEATRVAKFKHDRIVPVYDVGRENDTCFIVSEFIEGGSLKSVLATKRLPLAQAIKWICDIADALEYAHQQGIVHRDIKPANILIDHHDRAMLADFGIAQSPLKAGKSIGTLKYMSPEQLAGEPVDCRADIFSLGVVLHECLTGELPYRNGKARHVPATVEVGLPKAVAQRIPRPVRRVCERALSKEPQKRHATASAFANSLRRAHEKTEARKWLPVTISLMALGVAAFGGMQVAHYVTDALRPRVQIEALPDWKNNNQDLTSALNAISEAAKTQDKIPKTRLFAATKSPYEQMGGGVVAPNGKVYCLPSPTGSILAIDPVSQAARPAAKIADYTGLYYGAVLAPDGCIYGIPHGATKFFKLNPETNDVTTFGSAPGGGAYWGGVVANNGKIYCVPSTATGVLELDPSNQQLTSFGMHDAAQYKYSCGVLAPSGKIYCMPDRARKILIIDPDKQEISFVEEDLGPGAGKAFGGVLAPNGKIYSGMGGSNRMLVIDPATDTLSYIENLPASKYIGSVLGPDGKIYSIPHRHNRVLVIDPETHEFTYLANSETTGGHWGAVLTPHGSIIGVPREASNVLMIDFGVKVPTNWALSRLYNRF